MRIPSGHQFGSTQAGGRQEASDWRAKLDETFTMKPGAPHPHQSPASSCGCPHTPQTHPHSVILSSFALQILRIEIWKDLLPSS